MQRGNKEWSGKPLTNQNVNQKIRKALAELGFTEEECRKHSSHSFRKTVGAALTAEGERAERSAQVLGHKHASTTINYYSKPTQKQKRELLAKTGKTK